MKKRILPLLLALLCLSSLHATNGNQIQDLQDRVAALEKRGITPATGPCSKSGHGFFVYGGPIFARASADGLDYAITGRYDYNAPDAASYTMDITNGKAHQPNFHWGWGFILGLGYDLPYDGWDLASDWKRFHGKASGHLSTEGDPDPNNVAASAGFGAAQGVGQFISPFWVAKLFDSPRMMNRAAAHWHYKFDTIDLDLGREFLVSRALSLKPFIGGRTTWLKQNYNLKYLAFNFTSGPIAEPGEIARKIGVRMKNDLWGIGGKVGLNTTWFLGKGFCLYGTGAFSVLEGWYKARYKLVDQKPINTLEQLLGPAAITADPFTGTAVITRHLHTIFTMADLGVGFCWEKSLFNDMTCLSVKIGYDQSIYFGTNQFMNPQYDFTLVSLPNLPLEGQEGPNFFINGGNTSLSGVTGSITLTF